MWFCNFGKNIVYNLKKYFVIEHIFFFYMLDGKYGFVAFVLKNVILCVLSRKYSFAHVRENAILWVYHKIWFGGLITNIYSFAVLVRISFSF